MLMTKDVQTMHATKPINQPRANADKGYRCSAETGLDNFFNLIRCELKEPLAKLAQLAARVEELHTSGYLTHTMSGKKLLGELSDTARHCNSMTDRLMKLGDVFTGPPLASDERILLAETLRQSAIDLREHARKKNIAMRMEVTRENLAPVYGSAHWLRIALRHLLSLLINNTGAGMQVLLRLRQVGFHQLLSGTISHFRTSQGSLDLLQCTPSSLKRELACATRSDQLDLILVRAIIELHGGTIKTDQTEGGNLNEFHMTLPTGEPQAMERGRNCRNCQQTLQAEQFARDIGELLSTTHGKNASHLQRETRHEEDFDRR